jgi:endonuclease YncB( thermonuclease family)
MWRQMKHFNHLLFLAIFVASFVPASAQTTVSDVKDSDYLASTDPNPVISGKFAERRVTGKIVSLYEGGTATVLDDNKVQYKIRFNGIDAPEAKQDFGSKLKETNVALKA